MPKENIQVLMTERPDGPEDKSTLRTPSDEANVTVVTLEWYSQVGIRVLRTYLQGLVGFLGAGLTVGAAALNLPVGDFYTLLKVSASLAIAPAAMSFLHNMIEILGKYDITNPKMRA